MTELDFQAGRPSAERSGSPTRPVNPSAESSGSPTRPVNPSAESSGSPTRPVNPSAESSGSPTRPVNPSAESSGSPTRPVNPSAEPSGSPTRPVNPSAERRRGRYQCDSVNKRDRTRQNGLLVNWLIGKSEFNYYQLTNYRLTNKPINHFRDLSILAAGNHDALSENHLGSLGYGCLLFRVAIRTA